MKTRMMTINDIHNICLDCGEKYGEYKWGHVWVWWANCDICWKYTVCCAPSDYKYLKKIPKKIKKPEIQIISQDKFWELIGWNQLSERMKYCSTKPDDSDREKERDNFKYLYSNYKLW